MAFSSIHFFLLLMIRAYSSWKSKIQYLKYKNIYIWVWLNEHPYSMHSGYLLFFETTIMGKTADLAMVQKTIIDTLHKDTLSQIRSFLKAVAVHRVLYQSILNARLTGRNTFGRKRCTTGMTASLKILSSTADSNTWKSFTRSELKLEYLGCVTSSGVGPLCFFIKSKVNAAIYQKILEHFFLPSANNLYRYADFIFQQYLSTCPQYQNHFQVVCWPW